MKSTAFLTIIMTINWIFEIISFYNETSSTLFDIINALQGVLIFLMFVCLPRPMKLIKRWWKDRGSFQVLDNKPSNSYDIQMTSLSKQWVRQGERRQQQMKSNGEMMRIWIKEIMQKEITKWSSLLVQLRWFVLGRLGNPGI
jgi:hypothetical protein